jgi:hypothetical protein
MTSQAKKIIPYPIPAYFQIDLILAIAAHSPRISGENTEK